MNKQGDKRIFLANSRDLSQQTVATSRHTMYISQLASILLNFGFVSRQNNTNTQGNFYNNFITILLSFKRQKLSRFCHIDHCENYLYLDAAFRHKKSMSEKIFTKKYSFASFNNDRILSLNNKRKDYVDRNTGGQVYSLV